MANNLTELLSESKETQGQIIEGIGILESSIAELSQAISELDEEVRGSSSKSDTHELLQTKSSLLQLKAEFLNQLEVAKSSLKSLNSAIVLFEKAIQLNTGDIF